MSFIITKQKNNKIAITTTADICRLEEIIKNMNLLKEDYIICNKLDVDSKFFDAYLFSKDGPVFDSASAKNILLEYYRRARTPLLEKLDLEYIRADEAGDLELKKEIVAKKQALRDVTKTELPDDLEGIKNTWPEILGRNPFIK